MIDSPEKFEELSAQIRNIEDLERLRFTNTHGGEDALIGVSTRYFLSDGHIQRRRLDAIAAAESYCARFRAHLTHYITDMDRGRRLGEQEAFAYFRSKADLVNPDINCLVLALAGVSREEEEGPYAMPRFYDCRLQMNMPAYDGVWLYSDWSASVAFSGLAAPWHETLLTCVLEWAAILRPRHGTSGVSFLFSYDLDRRDPCETIFPHLMRHPGIDYDDGGAWVQHVNRNAKTRSINWLNVIDDGFVRDLGGRKALELALGPACPVHTYPGGVVIQAGPQPEAGDVNYGMVPEPYRTVARVLKPIRFEQYRRGLLSPPEPLDPVQETLKWIRRFD